MKQTIEVEVRNGTDEGEYVVAWPSGYRDEMSASELRELGFEVPEPAPERTEYPLQRITESQFNGRTSIHDFDEVLVAAHSLRAGDRIEWAPGDWREITEVRAHSNTVMAVYTAVGLLHLARPTVVAVRR